jgi:hypothetical protein
MSDGPYKMIGGRLMTRLNVVDHTKKAKSKALESRKGKDHGKDYDKEFGTGGNPKFGRYTK